MSNENSVISKRELLKTIGILGGSAAMYTAMQGLNKVHASLLTEPPKMSTEGNGKKIVILGGGISGMVTAIEMLKKGYECEIIEATSRAGGRCQSGRKGTVVQDQGGETQVCNFADDQYLNYGPWRIPVEHYSTLYYCRTLGVALEPMINKSSKAYLYSENSGGPFQGRPIRQHEVEIDRQGSVMELLAKCAHDGSLDDKVDQETIEMLVDYMRNTGLLSRKEMEYRGNRARGYSNYPGVGMDLGELSDPYDLKELLQFKMGRKYETSDHPAVMFQAVGGMDQVAKGMFDALPKNIFKFNSEIIDINQSSDEVVITYKNTESGAVSTTRGDYCVCALPFPVLTSIKNNFRPELMEALKAPSGVPAIKFGVQMDRRFWEQDEMIFGGTSVTDIPGQGVLSYPSSDLHSDKGGVLLCAYSWGSQAAKLSNLSVEERVEFALSVGEKLHPGKFRKHYNGNAITMAWHKQKYSLGGWASWTARKRRKYMNTVLKGEERILFSSDTLYSEYPGWMGGAIEAAWLTMKELDKRAAQG
ncbi:flavin monoamine oxidase family protein [Pseudemcibacter aquimaris]|uniref:flavin monoamine oxidase family protein n=1 Tax=Pseudemcibacter aquimaris TaxID=2857064 RepID=UPI0020134EAA|nr:FAD-dependent oxidoreductase [Pseudemcibacter aquimaris]MCC3860274.1 FAD-dependent oxidoreductase [Pseudemcibacter aquimaris]WDU57599.1 FAD-dependent oxidoreductase [Pseudemcibacter aquimaris]